MEQAAKATHRSARETLACAPQHRTSPTAPKPMATASERERSAQRSSRTRRPTARATRAQPLQSRDGLHERSARDVPRPCRAVRRVAPGQRQRPHLQAHLLVLRLLVVDVRQLREGGAAGARASQLSKSARLGMRRAADRASRARARVRDWHERRSSQAKTSGWSRRKA